MIDLGFVRPGATIRIPFSSFDKDDGSSITMTNFAVGDILVYKDGDTTERASTAGFTATTDFDGKTGKHLAIIDLADNTTAGFFSAGSEYLVAIDAVTVDAVTTGGWIARFRIGYQHAILNTTIATLSSQTSFTLSNGPAEDDALNGCVVLIHDVAGAVQFGFGVISDYTGSTKTVTLTAGVTFTAAASDNAVIFPPVNVEYFHALAVSKVPLAPSTAGRDLDVSTGGEAGLDWANIGSPTTAQNLSATNFDVDQVVASVSGAVGSVTGAVGSVTGNVGGNVVGSVASVTARVTANVDQLGGVAQSLTDLKDFADDGYDPSTNKVQGVVLTDTTTTVTGGATAAALTTAQADLDDIQTRLPAALAADGSIKASVQSFLGTAFTEGAAGRIAAAFKQFFNIATPAATMDHGILVDTVTTATTATNLTNAATNGDLTTAMKASVNAEADTALADYDGPTHAELTTEINDVQADIAALNDPTAAAIADAVWDEAIAGHLGAGSTGEALSDAGGAGTPPTVGEIADGVWDEARAGHVGAGSFGEGVASVQGSVTGSVGSVSGNVGGNVAGSVGSVSGAVGSVTGNVGGNVTGSVGSLATQAKADVNAEADTALADVGVTTTITGRIDAAVTTRASQASVDTIDDFLDTEIAAILAAVDTEVASIKTATDQLTAAQAEPSAPPAANASPLAKIAWMGALARNKITQTSTTQTLRDDADSADIATATVSDDGSVFTRSEWS